MKETEENGRGGEGAGREEGEKGERGWQKNNFGQILTFAGSCTDPLLPMTAKSGVLQLTQSARFRVKIHLDRFILSPSGGEKKLNFCHLCTSAFSDVDSWRQSEKVEHGCTTTNLPLSNGIKIISVLQRLHGEIGRTNSDVQKRDGQAKRDGQTKKQRFHRPGGG